MRPVDLFRERFGINVRQASQLSGLHVGALHRAITSRNPNIFQMALKLENGTNGQISVKEFLDFVADLYLQRQDKGDAA